MTSRKPISTEKPRLEDCICYQLRRAGRITSKFYDNALKPSGLRNTQFTLIASLNQFGETSIGDLSQMLATDGTTLTRNLEVLIRRGLIENVEVDDGRVRNVRLTELGHAKLEEAVPLWQQAHHKVLMALGPEPWSKMRSQLNEVEAACSQTG